LRKAAVPVETEGLPDQADGIVRSTTCESGIVVSNNIVGSAVTGPPANQAGGRRKATSGRGPEGEE